MRTLPKPKINNRFDIPYLAGYAADEATLFIDRRVPQYYKQPDGKTVDVYFFLSIHESLEIKLIDAFGLNYESAHAIATKAEYEALKLYDVDADQYSTFMDYYIWLCAQRAEKCPKNLDLVPYIDSNDEHTLRMIKKAQQYD